MNTNMKRIYMNFISEEKQHIDIHIIINNRLYAFHSYKLARLVFIKIVFKRLNILCICLT